MSSDITSRTQRLIGYKWRIIWFYVTYDQPAVGSIENIAMMHIMNTPINPCAKATWMGKLGSS